MSDHHVLPGVQTTLLAALSEWNTDNCKPMPDGQPEPISASQFAAIHVLNVQGAQKDDGIHEEIWSFSITVSKRIKAVPYDRINTSVYLTHLSGISPIMKRIKYALNNRWSLVRNINALIDAENDPDLVDLIDIEGFIHPALVINQTPKMSFRNEEWFHGTHRNPDRDAIDGVVGISMSLDFGQLLKQTHQPDEVCVK